jgi:hypothetical protein
MTTDLLFQIFQQYLHDPSCQIESSREFIQKVVGAYLVLITRGGNIPEGHLETIIEDLEAEVLEMFRKKTYGYYNLKEYRQSIKE